MTPTLVQNGHAEFLKAAVHAAVLVPAAACAIYNVVAWWYRREPHLARNGVIYSLLVGREVAKVLHHLRS